MALHSILSIKLFNYCKKKIKNILGRDVNSIPRWCNFISVELFCLGSIRSADEIMCEFGEVEAQLWENIIENLNKKVLLQGVVIY